MPSGGAICRGRVAGRNLVSYNDHNDEKQAPSEERTPCWYRKIVKSFIEKSGRSL